MPNFELVPASASYPSALDLAPFDTPVSLSALHLAPFSGPSAIVVLLLPSSALVFADLAFA